MKRPPGIWILLSAGVLLLNLHHVNGVRATQLIFGKTTTTTTPPTPVKNVTDEISNVETTTNNELSVSNTTKHTLTGIPQIDYLYDPNLPKELNGYNLSEYPFYERVPDPEEIDFKCDGLHDGFYASIPFKCQVYHHCLFGTRYDFLCANYTAFDQKTFICQFVSDVDCVGSKKFWHRNDALYKAATTTTLKPLNIYTTAEPSASQDKNNNPHRGNGKRRRPYQRRPQFDYYDDDYAYDDYYEERPTRGRRRRPRPRPRPAYDDEYDEEYDETYETRNRRPQNRRGTNRRNKNRDEEERPNRNKNKEEEEDERPSRNKNREEDDERPNRNKNREEDDERPNRNKNRGEDDDRPNRNKNRQEDEDRPNRKKNRDENEDRPNRPKNREDGSKRPNRKKINNDEDDFEERPKEKRKQQQSDEDDERIRKKGNKDEDYDEHPPARKRQGSRRPPPIDDYEDEPHKKSTNKEEEVKIIKPTTGTIYDKPRVAPRIKPPVPKNEANKYAYKPIKSSTTTSSYADDEYYDDYEEAPKLKNKKIKEEEIKPKFNENKERQQNHSRNKPKPTSLEEYDEDEELILTPKPKVKENTRNESRSRGKTQPKPKEEEIEKPKRIKTKINENTTEKKVIEYDDHYDDYENDKSTVSRFSSTENVKKFSRPNTVETSTIRLTTTTTRTTTTTTTTQTPFTKERNEQIVRIVKRPFLPSRGGNPFSSRGLQPLGLKAPKSETLEKLETTTKKNENQARFSSRTKGNKENQPKYTQEQTQNVRSKYQPIDEAPTQFKTNSRQQIPEIIPTTGSTTLVKFKFNEPITDNDDDFKPMKSPQLYRANYDTVKNYNGPRTTQKPKILEKNPLDYEYDVTLNDALNPTLPNLPVRQNYQNGFNPASDYTYSTFQRPKYILETTNSNYFQPKQKIETIEYQRQQQQDRRDQYVAPSIDYKNFYTPVFNNGNPKRGNTNYYTSF